MKSSKKSCYKKCCAPGCDVHSRTHSEAFFSFPSSQIRFKIWREFLGISDNPHVHLFLCARHFARSDFFNSRREKLHTNSNPSYVTGPLNPVTGDYCPVDELPVTIRSADPQNKLELRDLPNPRSCDSTDEIIVISHTCLARGCHLSQLNDPDTPFHHSPRECSKRAEEWREALGLRSAPHRYSVCARHFGAHQYSYGDVKRCNLYRDENPLYRTGPLNPIFRDYSPLTREQYALYSDFILGETIDWAYIENTFQGKADLVEVNVLIMYMDALAKKSGQKNFVAEIPKEYWHDRPQTFRKINTKLRNAHNVDACNECSKKPHVSNNKVILKELTSPLKVSDAGSGDEEETSYCVENYLLGLGDGTKAHVPSNQAFFTKGNVIRTEVDFSEIHSMGTLKPQDHTAVIQDLVRNRVLVMTKQNGEDWTMGETREASSFLITKLLNLSVNYEKYQGENGLGCGFHSSSLVNLKSFMILCSDLDTANVVLEELSDTVHKEGWRIQCWPDMRKPVISAFIPGCIISKVYAMRMMEFFNRGKGLHVSAWKMKMWLETENGVKIDVEVPCEDGFIIQKLGTLCFELRRIKFEVNWPQEISRLMASVNGVEEWSQQEMPNNFLKPAAINDLKESSSLKLVQVKPRSVGTSNRSGSWLMASVNGVEECSQQEMPNSSPKPAAINDLKGSTSLKPVQVEPLSVGTSNRSGSRLIASVNGVEECSQQEMPNSSPKPAAINDLKGSTSMKPVQVEPLSVGTSNKSRTSKECVLTLPQKVVMPLTRSTKIRLPVGKNVASVAKNTTIQHSVNRKPVPGIDCMDDTQKENVACITTNEIRDYVKQRPSYPEVLIVVSRDAAQEKGEQDTEALSATEKVHSDYPVDEESCKVKNAMKGIRANVRTSKDRNANALQKLDSLDKSTFDSNKSPNPDTSSDKLYKKRRCEEAEMVPNGPLRQNVVSNDTTALQEVVCFNQENQNSAVECRSSTSETVSAEEKVHNDYLVDKEGCKVMKVMEGILPDIRASKKRNALGGKSNSLDKSTFDSNESSDTSSDKLVIIYKKRRCEETEMVPNSPLLQKVISDDTIPQAVVCLDQSSEDVSNPISGDSKEHKNQNSAVECRYEVSVKTTTRDGEMPVCHEEIIEVSDDDSDS